MTDSILDSTKKVLGIDSAYTAFDPDIVMHINSVLATLNQMGIGPEHGFAIEDSGATWTTFLGTDLRFNLAKSFTYLRVRMLFDPPATSFHLTSMNEQINELSFRLSVLRESNVVVPVSSSLDGGNAVGG